MKVENILFKDSRSDFVFRYTKSYDEPSDFELHTHRDMVEIIIFIQGDASFAVEGSSYPARPWDVFITNQNELHKMCLNSPCDYERYVLHIHNSFFVKNNCEMFRDSFSNRPLGINNLVLGNDYIKGLMEHILDCIKDEAPSIVIHSMLVELLYFLHINTKKTSFVPIIQSRTKEVILYINDNLTKDISLDMLSEKFFMNKAYLCRSFKKLTGITVTKYINYKRLLLARELYTKGMTLSQACEKAGFGDYTQFYKAYKREWGVPPLKDLKK